MVDVEVVITTDQFLIIGAMIGGAIVSFLWLAFKAIDQYEELKILRRKLEVQEETAKPVRM